MKMAGVISQGIVFPMSVLPEGTYQDEQDVTDILGIHQYEGTMDIEKNEPEEIQQKYPRWLMRWAWFRKLVKQEQMDREFPAFISKTDETRIQNAPFYLRYPGHWVATEKVDGQSGTFFIRKQKGKHFWNRTVYDFGVCSRNYRLPVEDSSTYWYVAKKYHMEALLKKSLGNMDFLAIQGECIGPKVQGNKYHVKQPELYVFNVITPQGRMDSESAAAWSRERGLKFVPFIDTDYQLPGSVQEVLDFAHGQSQLGDTLREGIVFRSKDGKQSFKAVDPLFLLKYDE
jgi:RNA ligase (TIGR02306 family)